MHKQYLFAGSVTLLHQVTNKHSGHSLKSFANNTLRRGRFPGKKNARPECCWRTAKTALYFWLMNTVSLFPKAQTVCLNRPGFPGECFICELRLPDHRFRWK
ncbi:hypothetical protein, partial [Escherichia coli]|uniref:hypothetical protein n=1 Tax=Escherichia coli TaxID=562 RepID=UPI001BFDE339